MVWVQFSGNESKEMLQIFELSYSQMANRFNSAHNYLLFLTIWKNNASQHILALNLLIVIKGWSSSLPICLETLSEAIVGKSHDILYIPKVNIIYVFINPGRYFMNEQLPELAITLWGKH